MAKWSTFYAARTYVETDLFTYFWLTVSPNVNIDGENIVVCTIQTGSPFSHSTSDKQGFVERQSRSILIFFQDEINDTICVGVASNCLHSMWRTVSLNSTMSIALIRLIQPNLKQTKCVIQLKFARPKFIAIDLTMKKKVLHSVRFYGEWQLRKGNVNNSSNAFFPYCRTLW